MIELKGTDGDVAGENILDAIHNGQVFSIKKTENGCFRVMEECDGCFAVYLSKEQLLELANELQVLANSV